MKRCYVFDIDGTLADITHRLHYIQTPPADWDSFFAACVGDAPIDHMGRLIDDLYALGVFFVYVSGRSDQVRKETETWLDKHGFPPVGGYTKLYMRKAGDHKPDHELKIELLADLRADGYEPILWFDDRNQVVKAVRAAGIPCLQVCDGNY
jgi:phosphoglycolate phosphatase-like HAD superfamily hydrolase